MNASQIVKRQGKLHAQRGNWETNWQDCADYGIPRKNDIRVERLEGEKKGVTLYDTTAVTSGDLLAGALHGNLTNPSTIWFDMSTGDDDLDRDDDIRKFLQDAARKMNNALNQTNFQTEIHEVYLDEIYFGTAAMSIEEDDKYMFRFLCHPLAEIDVEENNKGFIDTVFRAFKWTARQIVKEFGKEACPDEVIAKFEDDSQDKFEIIHAVYPRDMESVPKSRSGTPKGYPIASKYVLKKGEKLLREGGFREMPIVVPRWTKVSGERFGRGPMMKALPDVKMLNKMMETTIRAAQLAIFPPLMVPDDGVVLPLKTNPNGINYYRAGSADKVTPISSGTNVNFAFDLVEKVGSKIREAFYVDQLQLKEGPQMTATEVNARSEEMMRFLGPILGRQQFELLAPMIDRIFGIMLRKKAIVIPPEVAQKISGKYLSVRYSSLVARAQRASEGANINRFITSIAPFIQTDPTVMDIVDGDAALRYSASIYGMPTELIRDADKVKAIKQARNDAQQKQAAMAEQQHNADMMSKALPALAQTKQAGLMG